MYNFQNLSYFSLPFDFASIKNIKIELADDALRPLINLDLFAVLNGSNIWLHNLHRTTLVVYGPCLYLNRKQLCMHN